LRIDEQESECDGSWNFLLDGDWKTTDFVVIRIPDATRFCEWRHKNGVSVRPPGGSAMK
jgi:hypothetical protein